MAGKKCVFHPNIPRMKDKTIFTNLYNIDNQTNTTSEKAT